jgi:hypothetical protein
MKLAKLFKPETPFAEYRQKLRAAIEAGKISENTDASDALRIVLDSLDVVELVMVLEEQGEGDDLSARNVRGLLLRLDRLDREYERQHRK